MQDPANDPAGALRERDERLAGLLRAAAGGDGRAFEAFYTATARHAIAVVRRIAGDALAEDVLADCYFQAWRNAAQFDAARGSAITWLLTMARSRALDRIRQETLRHGGLTGAPDFDASVVEQGQAPGPEELLESVESRTRLHAALRELSANERWVLGLAYFRDFTQSEIATITCMPLGTVKSLMTRAQHKLRETLSTGLTA
ncbi:MAG: sigma-70 family RNA polymerase sigma factor [Burkholderiales bacterium]|nr:sigma-70 family RNA polymerase sigma factor [Burkholderiales bacterium]